MGTMQILYIALFFVGAILLLVSILGGDVDGGVELDVGDPDFDVSSAEVGADSPSVFSFRTISVFLLGFGAAGWVVLRNGGSVTSQILWSLAVGLVFGALYFLVMKFMYSMQGSSTTSVSSAVGKTGIVIVPTTSTGIAQVKVKTDVGMSEYVCKEKDGKELHENDTVKVVSSSAGVLVVEKE